MPAKRVEADTPRLTNFVSRARCGSSASACLPAVHGWPFYRFVCGGMQVEPRRSFVG